MKKPQHGSRSLRGVPAPTRRHILMLGGAVAASAALGACAGVPTAGGVHRYSDKLDVLYDKNTAIRAIGPQEGATPEAIIEGFIRAGADSSDNYSVARQFLVPGFASRWNPGSSTKVYRNTVQVSPNESNASTYRARVQQTALINDRGLTSTFTEASVETIDFKLQFVQGQWRIEECPDGLLLDGSEFERVFSPYRLYFYDPTYAYAVPDIRWFAHRDGQLGILLQTAMGGPAAYLKDVTVSSLSADMSLEKSKVAENGAKISIRGPSLGDSELALLRQQIRYILSNFSSVGQLELVYNTTLVDDQLPTGFQEAQMNPEVSQRVVGFQDGILVTREDYAASDSKVVTSDTIPSPSSPTINYKGTAVACLGDGGRSLYLVKGGQAQKLSNGKLLTAPTFDAFGWLWVAEDEGTIRAYNAASEDAQERAKGVEISVSWRHEMHFSSIRISHDGVRVVLVGARDGNAAVIMSGISRSSSGAPQGFTDPVRVSSSITPSTAVWAGEQSLVVVNTKNGESEVTTLSGEETKLDRLDGLERVSTAGDTIHMFAHRSDGSCYRLEDRGWSHLAGPLRDISFAG